MAKLRESYMEFLFQHHHSLCWNKSLTSGGKKLEQKPGRCIQAKDQISQQGQSAVLPLMMLDTFVQTNVSIPHVWHHFLTSIVPERAGQNKPALLECSGSGVWKGLYGHFKRKKSLQGNSCCWTASQTDSSMDRQVSQCLCSSGRKRLSEKYKHSKTLTQRTYKVAHTGYIHGYVRMHGLRHHSLIRSGTLGTKWGKKSSSV